MKNYQTLIAIMLLTSAVATAEAADSSVPTDFATLQAAIDDPGTVAGDTITLEAGTHLESGIHVTKAVTIAGTGVGSSILASPASGSGIGLFIDADDVTLRDLTIEDFSQAVRFEDAGGTIAGTTIDTVEMRDNTSRGIEIHNQTTVTDLTIEGCRFADTNIGLRVSSSGHLDGASITSSDFEGGTIGIYEANDGSTSTMRDVVVSGCSFTGITSGQGTAIFVEEAQDVVISDNTFTDNRRDIQIFKWYQASVKVSNVSIRDNVSSGATNACFAIFNAEHASGRTEFDGVTFEDNSCDMADGAVRAVYAGAHSAQVGDGGIGWETVHVNCNSFTGSFQLAVDFFDPVSVDGDTLGGAVLDVENNWWGTSDEVLLESLMEEPAITDFEPFLTDTPGGPDLPGDDVDQDCDGGDPCPCDARNHGQYMRCVAQEAEQLAEDGEITEEEKDCIVAKAGESDCGKGGAPPDYSDCF